MGSRGRDRLGNNAGIQDEHYLSPDESPFMPQGWDTVTNHYRDQKTLTPEGSIAGFGATTYFKKDRVLDMIGSMRLNITIGALSITGGTFERFVDFAAEAMVDNIYIHYQNYDIARIYGPQMHAINQKLYRTQEQRNNHAALVGGDLTVSERENAARASQNFILEIPVYWFNEIMTKPDLFLPMSGLPHPLEIDVTLRSLTSICNFDGTGTTLACTISAMTIDTTEYSITDPERYKFTEMIADPGIAYKVCVY